MPINQLIAQGFPAIGAMPSLLRNRQQQFDNTLQQQQYGLNERRVSAEEARLAQADAERQSQMDEQQKNQARAQLYMRYISGDKSVLPQIAQAENLGPEDLQGINPDQFVEAVARLHFPDMLPPASPSQWKPDTRSGIPGQTEVATNKFDPFPQSSISGAGGADPYHTMFQTAEGAYDFNNRSGQAVPLMFNGKPIIPSASDPSLQGNISLAKKRGGVLGEAWGGAEVNLPQVIDQANQSIEAVKGLLVHPGFKAAVGVTWLPGARFVEGTDAANFMRRLEQVQGGAFLEAYKTLKGGGQITEIEGKKATDAIVRMSKSQSEDEFKQAAQDYIDVISTAVERAKSIAAQGASFGNGQKAPTAGPSGVVRRYNPNTGKIE